MNNQIDNEINKLIGDSDKNNIIDKDTLVLSGGGSAGILYVGVFKALDELNILKNIKTIIGVSAGTMYSSMYLMGYTIKELQKFAETFDPKRLSSVKDFESLSFNKIFVEYGLDNGDTFKKVFSKVLKQKNIKPDITLLEFYNLNKIRFIIGVTNIDKLEEEYFSYDQTPNIKLIDAIRATISIPIYFTPYKINNTLYVDGGCMNNLPINYAGIDQNKIIPIMICNNIHKTANNNNFVNYILNILKTISIGWRNTLFRGCNNIINIDSGIINILNLNLDEKERKNLIKIGYDAIMNSNLNHLH